MKNEITVGFLRHINETTGGKPNPSFFDKESSIWGSTGSLDEPENLGQFLFEHLATLLNSSRMHDDYTVSFIAIEPLDGDVYGTINISDEKNNLLYSLSPHEGEMAKVVDYSHVEYHETNCTWSDVETHFNSFRLDGKGRGMLPVQYLNT